LPDVFGDMDGIHPTTKKHFTPKKVVLGTEVVATDFDVNQFDRDREKWVNKNYPNLQRDEIIPAPPVVIDPTEPSE
jgi:hypothetical protein